jgi:glycosyltransferase involved in cell wall biosynthesis
VILPVYNEESTIADVIDGLLALPLPDGVRLELVIVESNSTDDTRALVGKYADPRVEVVLQDEARGKGHAVREGLTHVSGDIVLIQDGDLEYDLADYPALLEPILAGRSTFVLGSRHVKGRPMRNFADARMTSRLLNAGHWVFTALFNLFYGTRLRDPFTMYKVSRTECIDGMEFVSDRFDFDWELMAKLVRSGHEPTEIPVSYHSRGYDEGKKVRILRDPVTWIVALFRFRFSTLEAAPAAGAQAVGAGHDRGGR